MVGVARAPWAACACWGWLVLARPISFVAASACPGLTLPRCIALHTSARVCIPHRRFAAVFAAHYRENARDQLPHQAKRQMHPETATFALQSRTYACLVAVAPPMQATRALAGRSCIDAGAIVTAPWEVFALFGCSALNSVAWICSILEQLFQDIGSVMVHKHHAFHLIITSLKVVGAGCSCALCATLALSVTPTRCNGRT